MESTPHRNPRFLTAIFLLGFLSIFSTTISKNPVLPLFSHALGASDATIGMIAAVSPFAGILFSFPAGVLSDHLGRKRLLVVSGLVFLSAPLLYLLVTNPLWLIPVRFFHGTATAILMPVIGALIVERFPDRKGEVLGQYSSSTLMGRALAPLVAGAIIAAFAWYDGLLPYRMVYAAAALAAVPVMVLTLKFREDSRGVPATLPPSLIRRSLVTFFADRRLRSTALVEAATYFGFGAFETFLPLLLLSRGLGALQTGSLFAVQVLLIAVTKPFFGRMADRADKRVQILAGLLILGCCMAAIPSASSFPGFLLVSALLGLGMSLSTVATSAYTAEIAKQGTVGASMGALSALMDIGHSLGPLITGIIISLYGYGPGFFASFLITAITSAFFLLSVLDPEP